MKSLADHFKIIQQEQLDAARSREIAEQEAAFMLRNKERYDRSDLVKAISTHIDNELHRGKMPLYTVYGTAHRKWIRDCDSNIMADDFDLWSGLVAWLRNEGLTIKVSGWDGYGSSVCTEVSVELLPGPEIEAD